MDFENFTGTTLQQLQDFWNETASRYDKAVRKKRQTRDEFNHDADRRDQVIQSKIAELDKELEGIKAQTAKVGGEYGNALSAGNKKEADRLQAETDKLALKEFQITRRKETVSKTKVIYDSKLFDAALEAYDQADDAYDAMNESGLELEALIEKMVTGLNQLHESIFAKRNVLSSYDDEVAMVGERGPELVYFRGGEQVLNAQETQAALRGTEAISATPGRASEPSAALVNHLEVKPSIVIEGGGIGSLQDEATVQQLTESIKSEVLDALEEAKEYEKRSAYSNSY